MIFIFNVYIFSLMNALITKKLTEKSDIIKTNYNKADYKISKKLVSSKVPLLR